MDESRDYWISGYTYPLREVLKEWGCIWDSERKKWRVYYTKPGDMDYEALTKRYGLTLVPCEDELV